MKNKNAILDKIKLSDEIKEIILKSPSCIFLNTRDEILSLAMSNQLHGEFEVAYDVPGHGRIVEATVTKCTNGLAVNYPTPYMRRRDPECMTVADPKQTDKIRYIDQFGVPFDSVRLETFDWLKKQNLAVMFFVLGGYDGENEARLFKEYHSENFNTFERGPGLCRFGCCDRPDGLRSCESVVLPGFRCVRQ